MPRIVDPGTTTNTRERELDNAAVTAARLLAFAIIQQPWQALDAFVHPDARELGIEEAMMVWVAERMQELAAELAAERARIHAQKQRLPCREAPVLRGGQVLDVVR